MRRLLLFAAAILLLVACGVDSSLRESLDIVESVMEDNPEEAMRQLSAIDSSCLRSTPLKARYSLLKSMALDKTYIDKTDFDVIRPALDYYSQRGSATEKLRTGYYQGRIYQNRGNLGLAMDCFVRVEDDAEKSCDKLTAARLYSAEALIYEKLYDFEKAIDANVRACSLFSQTGKERSRVNILSRIVNEYTLLGDAAGAARYLDLIEFSDSSVFLQNKNYWSSLLVYYVSFKKPVDEVESIVYRYLHNIRPASVDWLSVANAFCNIGKLEYAEYALEQYVCYAKTFDKERYAAVNSRILSMSGNYAGAFECYEKYVHAADSARLASYRTDAQFVAERFELEKDRLEEREEKNKAVFAGISMLLVASLVICVVTLRYRSSLLERDRLLMLYDRILTERDALFAKLKEGERMTNEEARAALKTKLALFDHILAAGISDNNELDNKAFREMERMILNSEEFLELNRLSFIASHPSFIRYLESKGLTEWEVGYCCLYAIGLRGKDIGKYLNKGGHFNISSRIREKLGISSHDTNLGIYVRKLLGELY